MFVGRLGADRSDRKRHRIESRFPRRSRSQVRRAEPRGHRSIVPAQPCSRPPAEQQEPSQRWVASSEPDQGDWGLPAHVPHPVRRSRVSPSSVLTRSWKGALSLPGHLSRRWASATRGRSRRAEAPRPTQAAQRGTEAHAQQSRTDAAIPALSLPVLAQGWLWILEGGARCSLPRRRPKNRERAP